MNEQKIDRRRHYYLMLDTETANTIQEGDKLNMFNVLAYDFGWAVIDKHGNVYETASFVNADVFDHMTDLMKSAYYAWKIPIYEDRIAKGEIIKSTTKEIKRMLWEIMERYKINEVVAHNCRFDYRSCNNTQRYTTQSTRSRSRSLGQGKRFWSLRYGASITSTSSRSNPRADSIPPPERITFSSPWITSSSLENPTTCSSFRESRKDKPEHPQKSGRNKKCPF